MRHEHETSKGDVNMIHQQGDIKRKTLKGYNKKETVNGDIKRKTS